jgi:hypothetical protein
VFNTVISRSELTVHDRYVMEQGQEQQQQDRDPTLPGLVGLPGTEDDEESGSFGFGNLVWRSQITGEGKKETYITYRFKQRIRPRILQR